MSKTKECFAYNTKIIETPTTKEVYIYENPIFIHSKEKADLTDTSNRKKFDEMSAHKQYDSLKRKQKHYEQARCNTVIFLSVYPCWRNKSYPLGRY